MAVYDVIILTDSRYIRPTHINTYIQNILDEDRLMQEALEAKGLTVTRVAWDNKIFDWRTAYTALFRTTWDYIDRYEAFMVWLEATSRKLTFINPIDLVKWNLDKNYLQDLAFKGVNIPETLFLEAGEQESLRTLIQSTGWNEVILKPVFAAGARHTYRISNETISEHEEIFRKLIAEEAMLLQLFQKSIVEKGEVSLVYFGGKYSHAIRKIAKTGDFRVQDDFGGTVHEYKATNREKVLAEKSLSACTSMPLYARIDIIEDNNGKPALSELELVEPELWFRLHPKAADLLAQVLYNHLLSL